MNVFRDRNNPLEVLNDIEVIVRYRLPRNVLIRLVELVREDVERPMKRSHSLSALTQGNNSCTSSPIIFTYLIKARITYYSNSSTYTLRKPMLWNVQYDKKKIKKFLKRKGMNKTIRNLTQQKMFSCKLRRLREITFGNVKVVSRFIYIGLYWKFYVLKTWKNGHKTHNPPPIHPLQ